MQQLPTNPNRSAEDHRLMEEFLRRTVWSNVSPEVAGPLIGATGAAVRKWMTGEWEYLQYETRKAISDYLTSSGLAPDDGEGGGGAGDQAAG